MGTVDRAKLGLSRASVLVSVCDAFQDVVRQTPDRLAVKHGKYTLTYEQLDAKSARCAAGLIEMGVKPGDCVGLKADRGVDAIIAMLAILRAGASYVPLPEYYGDDKLHDIVLQADLNIVIGDVPSIADIAQIVELDALDTGALAGKLPRLGPDMAAYVMFTSGSTGAPKGVIVPHRAIMRLVIEPDFMDLTSEERIAQLAPLAFDASTLEIWGALLGGGLLVIPAEPDLSLRSLGDLLRAEEITTIWLTAGLFHAMAEERPGDFASLNQLLTGGDVVRPDMIERVRAACPELAIINGYGPTENTTFTLCHTIRDKDLKSGQPIPIGRPISGTGVFILDDDLKPVPPGEKGEICANGDGLALGYLGRPDLTDEVFVKAPWDTRIDLYRTGDIGSFDPDGFYHFHGRRDRQVKLRGYRVELDAVETALAGVEGVQDAAVIVGEGADSADKRLLAFYTAADTIDHHALTQHLAKTLPSFAIPQDIKHVENIALNASGKVDRKALSVASPVRADPPDTKLDTEKPDATNPNTVNDHTKNDHAKDGTKNDGRLEQAVKAVFCDILGVENFDRKANFFDLGVSSLQLARAHERLQVQIGRNFPITDLFAQGSVAELSKHLTSSVSVSGDIAPVDTGSGQGDDLIAIVGMAGRFPGADNVDALWKALIEGRELISHFSADELDTPAEDGAVPARGIVDGADMFDARHFGIPPREAEKLDPQHRILLEVAQTTLEDAGVDPDRFNGRIGVFAGVSQNSYLLANLLSAPGASREFAAGYPVKDFATLFGNDKDFMTTRLAYKLNLRGPAVNVQCACSTSLVAVAEACQALIAGRADMALAGGVSITFPQKRAYAYTPDGMASSDGHCRTFDADASGTVFGDGAGMVALKRLSDAERDGDDVVAVIRGFAINNDGSAKAGFAAPSVTAQADVIRAAHKASKVTPDQIGYVEAHGTGTPLGDPIEFAALDAAFGKDHREKCWLGTAKTNLGHLDIAAGVTGLIKTALTLKHAQIPALLHYKAPNKAIDFEASAFRPVTDVVNWSAGDAPRIAGISAFGVGGTNIHMVLQEAPARAIAPANTSAETSSKDIAVLPISASSKPALKAAISQLGVWAKHAGADINAVAKTLRDGRREYGHRAVLVASDMADLAKAAADFTGPIHTPGDPKQLVFLFPGQGSQHFGMGRTLYDTCDEFRAAIEICDTYVMEAGDESLIDLLYAPEDQADDITERLKDTRLAQPAIFAISYALARQWAAWGVTPDAMIGHSVGEFVAATMAGVMSLEDAVGLVRLRGALMSDLERGSMISVAAAEVDLTRYLDLGLDVASVNGAKSTVLAGPDDAVDAALAQFEEDGIAAKRLHTSHAFHSRMMDPAVEPFRAAVAKLDLKAPDRPILSTVTGDWLTAQQATDPDYWAGHMRAPVRFFDAVQAIQTDTPADFIEVGPGRTLSVLASQTGATAIASQPHAQAEDRDAQRAMLAAFGGLWALGRDVDWTNVVNETPDAKVKIPTYPFQRERFWVDPYIVVQGAEVETAPDTANVVATPVAPQVETIDPLTAVQQMLSDLSGIPADEMEPDTSFLALGFDSLLLTQATKEIADNFGLKVSLRELIDAVSTPAALAAQIKPQTRTVAASAPTSDAAIAAPAAKAERPNVPTLSVQSDVKAAVELLTPAQRTSIDVLVKRFNDKTKTSKALTEKHRATHADPRTASGFDRLWKEMVYQIVTTTSKGSRLLDVDGNEYIDILNGFGPGFLGHGFQPVVDAVHEQLDAGFEVGPQSIAAMESASLFAEVTGNDRASFVCTGSEAVYAAMRLARTCTGRDKIVMFARDYHGNFDEVLARGVGQGDDMRTLPSAPGIPRDSVKNVIVLPYGTDASLEYIRANANDLAAVMIEPVQSRRPEFRPHEFIREVRSITKSSGSLFIFDEVVTGFRFGPRGAQAFYNVDADLVTYGKVVGGGMPLGVVSGKARYMDTFDGGAWAYGDDSFPTAPVTFFAGTFVRHPLAMASLRAMLIHFRDQPAHFWKTVDAKGDRLAGTLDRWFQDNDMPFEMPNCGSLMYLRIDGEQRFGPLFGAHMRDRGVFYLEGFPSYMTAAHDDADIDYVIDAAKDSALEMRAAGLLVGREPLDHTATRGVPPARLSLPGGKDKIAAQMAQPTPPLSIPTTEAQREIFAALAVSPDLALAYNECISLVLKGAVDTDILQQAVRNTISRHDALTARFSEDGLSMQIGAVSTIEIETVDLRGCSGTVARKRVDDLITQQTATPFVLQTGPLLRAQLVLLPHGAELILCGHHIVFDGWSIGVICDEIATLYDQQTDGRIATLDAAPSFNAYAKKDQAWLASDDAATSETFWRDALKDAPANFDIPTDHPRAPLRNVGAARFDAMFPADLVTQLKKTAASMGGTLTNLMLTAFHVHLARISGVRDVTIAVPSAGQSSRGMWGLVGHCVNVMPVRLRIGATDTMPDALRAVQRAMLDAQDHQNLTYGSLVRVLDLPRDMSRLPLTPVMFNMDRGIDLGHAFGAAQATIVSHPRQAENFELFLNLTETDGTVSAEWSYSTSLFDPETIAAQMADFTALLQRLARDHDRPLAGFLARSRAETEAIAQVSRGSNIDIADTGLPDLITVQVEHDRNAPAVQADAVQLSYGALDARANQIANSLIARGIGKGALVGVALDRTPDLVAALLGVMKTGAGYVPLDPSFPKARLDHICADCNAALLLVDDGTSAIFEGRGPDLLNVNADEVAKASDSRPMVKITGDDIAYVIYTSGSTGNPKGVEIQHKALMNFLQSTARMPGIRAKDRLLAVTTVSFDIAGLEMWLPLTKGAQVVLASNADVTDPKALATLIDTHDITIMQATPSLWHMMIAADWKGAPNLTILAGGEALPRALARDLTPRVKAVWNMYGPTETTIWSTCWQVKSGEVMVGRPFDNTTLHVLDDALSPVPTGVVGALYIGGAGLAKGYLGRSDLTDAAFINHPQTGARIYQTGDIARWKMTDTGYQLQCLGRSDSQIKLRGYRIELGEIDAALSDLPEVEAAAALLRNAGSDMAEIAGFVTLRRPVDPSDLRVRLSARLPGYMVPARIIVLDTLPMTPNGKIDRKALAAVNPTQSGSGQNNNSLGDLSPSEAKLAAIWSGLLSTDTMTRDANFFELGGHSLLAVKLFAKIRDEWSLDLPISTLFLNPTLGGLAQSLQTQSGAVVTADDNFDPDGPWDTTVEISAGPGGSNLPLFIVGGVGGNVNNLYHLGTALGRVRPVVGLQMRGIMGHTQHPDLKIMAADHIAYIRQRQPHGPYLLAGYSGGAFSAFEIAHQLKAAGETVAFLGILDMHAPGFALPKPITMWERAKWEANAIKSMGVKSFISRARTSIRKRAAGHLDENFAIGNSDLRKFDRLVRDWWKMVNSYEPKRFDGNAQLFIGRSDGITDDMMKQQDPNLGWDDLIQGDLTVVNIDAHHNDLLIGAPLDEVIETLNTQLKHL